MLGTTNRLTPSSTFETLPSRLLNSPSSDSLSGAWIRTAETIQDTQGATWEVRLRNCDFSSFQLRPNRAFLDLNGRASFSLFGDPGALCCGVKCVAPGEGRDLLLFGVKVRFCFFKFGGLLLLERRTFLETLEVRPRRSSWTLDGRGDIIGREASRGELLCGTLSALLFGWFEVEVEGF